MIPLCIDARWLESGIGSYTANLVEALSRCEEISLSLLTLPRHVATMEQFSGDVRAVDASMYSLREQIAVPRAVGEHRSLHTLHYNIPLRYKGTLVVTIHDLTHILDERLRSSVKSKLYAAPMLKLAARKAAHIITGSEYSKRQIVDHLNVAPNHVTVSYYGVGRHFVPEPRDQAYERVRHECGVNGRYLLFVGNLKPHKNVDGLLRAFALIRSATASDVELLIIGEDRFGGPKLRELAARLGIGAATKFAGRVTMGLLRSAYAAAELTVLPSFEEGFGLPVLESMACGTPVACSRAASLPEIGGDAVEYFDPNSCDSMAHAIEGLLFASAEQRKSLGEKGLQRAKVFSWAECTSRHLDVYRRYCQA